MQKVESSFIDFVMNVSDEKITKLFADMGIEINLDLPLEVVDFQESNDILPEQ